MSSADLVLELRGVGKTYPGDVPAPVLFDISIAVKPGEFIAVVGASGSGKTTLLNLVGLLDSPTCGDISLGGNTIETLNEDERAFLRRDYLGFVFQFHYLLPEFTVLENALMPCLLRGQSAVNQQQERMISLLKEVGLAEKLNSYPSQLSGGQAQRAAIVRALANDPVLVLADEPTGNLDSKSGRAVFELMRKLNRQTGKAFLLVTHDETFAQEADRIIRLVDGRIQA